jgi:type I restriction enzyme S subunit
MSKELPKSWSKASFLEVAEINPRHPKDLDDSLVISFAPMVAISECKPEFNFLEDRSLGEVRKGFTHFREGDVLFAKITPCMENGKGAVARGLRNGIGCGTTELHVIRPIPEISPHYLYRFLAQASVRRNAKENFTGTAGQSRVPKKFIEELELPIAPLPEQKRIVAKLEALLAKVDACRRRLEKIPALLKRFRQSVLAAACSGRLTTDWRGNHVDLEPLNSVSERTPPENFKLPTTWNWLLSTNAFSLVTSGSRGWARYYAVTGAKFLRVGNLNHDSIDLDLKSIQCVQPPKNAEGRRTKVQQGDILISITADVGMVALVKENIGEAYINQHVALARPVDNMDRRYLSFFLSAKNGGQEQFLNLQRGATKVGLGLDDIRNIWIANPPIEEQHEIVRRVESLFKIADRIEERYQKAKTQVDKLTQSILAKAFRGELAPQDPNNESASELLSRLKKGRNPQEIKMPRRNRKERGQ